MIELLATVAIIAILASLLLTTVTRAKGEGRKAACINNFRQLNLAWQLYIDDNNGTLPFNWINAPTTASPGDPNWVGGWLTPFREPGDQRDNTNTLLLVNVTGGIGCYVTEPKVFKCPSDRSVGKVDGKFYPRVRSVAMNSYMRGNWASDPSDPEWYYATTGHLVAGSPAETGFVFIDTHEDSISTGEFLVARPTPAISGWNHFPASRHNGGATFSFADGHVICHRWIDSRTLQRVSGKSLYGVIQNGSADIRWVSDRATALRK